ncbi:hypothetical protein BV25DRAFT_377106 [Artomyces pyxidatus]|uniref:Uncharacterized protein n=1 Tax=Artomyces pyxidatus TaxID=48021 RepID=A0ACB8SE46_9AGAM|nr:hypothetical protein BV25DRAFT_377106 [Artomyces pyxidatus]
MVTIDMVLDSRHNLGVNRRRGWRRRRCGDYGLEGQSRKWGARRQSKDGRENAICGERALFVRCLFGAPVTSSRSSRVHQFGARLRHRPSLGPRQLGRHTELQRQYHDDSRQDDNAHDGIVSDTREQVLGQ